MKSIIRLIALIVLSVLLTGCNREPSYSVAVDYARNPYNTENADLTISIELREAPDDLEYIYAEQIDLVDNTKWDEDRYAPQIHYQNTDVIPALELGDTHKYSFVRLDPSRNTFVLRLEDALLDVNDWKDAGKCPFSELKVIGFIEGDWDGAPIAFPNWMEGDIPCKLKMPTATIWTEGTTIHRSEIIDDTGSDLTWIVKHDGEIVLERICRDKSQPVDDYEFDLVNDTDRSKPGEFTIVLVEGMPGKNQVVISNEISLVIPEEQSLSFRLVQEIPSDNLSMHYEWSPDGNKIAAIFKGAFQIWNATTGESICLERTRGGSMDIPIAWNPDGTKIATADWEISIFDSSTCQEIDVYQRPEVLRVGGAPTLTDLEWSPDGERLAYSLILHRSGQDVLEILDANTGTELHSLPHGASVASIDWEPEGNTLVSMGGEVLKMWNPNTGQLLKTIELSSHSMFIEWSPDGRFIATGACNEDNNVRVWDAQSLDLVSSFAPNSTCTRVTWSPDGRYLAAEGGLLRVWDAAKDSISIETAWSGWGPKWSPIDNRLIFKVESGFEIWEFSLR